MRRRRFSTAKVERLRRCELFSAFDDAALARIGAIGDEVEIPVGQVLTRQGEAARQAYVILEGSCRVEVDGAVMAQVGEGDIVGEIGMLDGRARSATVISQVPVRALVLDPGSFWDFVDQDGLRRKVLRQLAVRIRRLDELHAERPA